MVSQDVSPTQTSEALTLPTNHPEMPSTDEPGVTEEYFFALSERDPEKWRAISGSLIEGADIPETRANTAPASIEFDAAQKVVVYRENLTPRPLRRCCGVRRSSGPG